ncbi:MAG TPA: kelch repeat-containing protein [Gemmatimonadaceae bacterium]
MPRSTGLGAAVLKDRIHTLGGENPGVFANHEVYDPARDAWTTEAAMPTARHGLGMAVIVGWIYAISGGPHAGSRRRTLSRSSRLTSNRRDSGFAERETPGENQEVGFLGACDFLPFLCDRVLP